MFLKHIICQVGSNQKTAFSIAQTKWSVIKNLPGFIAQFGGWSKRSPNKAIIFSLWKSKTDYDFFMEKVHDTVFENNGQTNTYNTIEIQFHEVSDVPLPIHLDRFINPYYEGSIEYIASWNI